MKRKNFKIKDICYNKTCENNEGCFCTTRGLSPNCCIRSKTHNDYEAEIFRLNNQISDLEKDISTLLKVKQSLYDKIHEYENQTPLDHIINLNDSLKECGVPVSKELKAIFKGAEMKKENQLLNDRWTKLKNWLIKYELDAKEAMAFCNHITPVYVPPGAVVEMMETLEKEIKNESKV